MHPADDSGSEAGKQAIEQKPSKTTSIQEGQRCSIHCIDYLLFTSADIAPLTQATKCHPASLSTQSHSRRNPPYVSHRYDSAPARCIKSRSRSLSAFRSSCTQTRIPGRSANSRPEPHYGRQSRTSKRVRARRHSESRGKRGEFH